MKKTYKNQLPKGMEVESTNVRIENGEIFVDVELKERFEPKDGDILYIKTHTGEGLCIFKNKEDIWVNVYLSYYFKTNNMFFEGQHCGVGQIVSWRKANDVEISRLNSMLENKHHKRFNQKTKEWEDIRWRADKGAEYYFVNDFNNVIKDIEWESGLDITRYKLGNYFRTPEAARKVSEQIKDIFKNSKA